MKSVDEWASHFRQYEADRRKAIPLARREKLTLIEESRCQIIGGSFLQWLQELGPRFLEERAIMSKLLNVDTHPFVVFTSDMPGLVAANELVGADSEQVGFLLKEEFDNFQLQISDPTYRWHIHVWSYFHTRIEDAMEAEARMKYPLPNGCEYWVHSEGTMWAENAGRGGEHLWKWDGREATLLEEAISSWVT